MMKCQLVRTIAAFAALGLVLIGCTQASPAAAPTGFPASGAPTKAPTAVKATEPTKAPATPVPAVTFPEKGKSITFMVPFAAGGGSDLLVRALTPFLEKDLGVPIVNVAKPGAATQVAMTELVKAKPDGYTISIATLITTPVTYLDPERQASYGRKDLLTVANLVVEDMVLNVKADSPWKTVKDLVDAANAAPGKIRIGTTGLMGIGHLAALALQQEAGTEFAFVHFEGSGPATTALLGGHVEVTCTGAGAAFAHVKSGALRVVGYLDSQQSKFFPDVKPITEQGYKVVMPAAYGVVAPAGTPKAVVDRLASALKAAVENKEVEERLAEIAFAPRFMDSAKFSAYWDEAEAQAAPLIKLAKAQAQ